MKIINHGKGIHQREILGINYLQQNLPDEWVAHTNLAISLPHGAREIDVILFAVDRIFLIDLKDGHGKYTSSDGGWVLNEKPQEGQSPVQKILDNAREVYSMLSRFLSQHAQRTGYDKVPTPQVTGIVVLTSSYDLSGIAATEELSVFTAKNFVSLVKDTNKRLERFGKVRNDFVSPPIYSQEWGHKLNSFFNLKFGFFKRGVRRYGQYLASSDGAATYVGPLDIYQEFIVHDDSAAKAAGLLRRWDFSKADTRFQTEDGRFEIAGRERSIIGWLNDRNEICANAVLQPKAEDSEKGVDYWEVYDQRRRMKRLSEFALSELPRLRSEERIEIVRQMLHQVQCLHTYQTAHLDIGEHSVWVALPSEVKLSHLMSARYPEAASLGDNRYQFLSSMKLPDSELDFDSSPEQKDVYHLGCLIHLILFEDYPQSNPYDWNVEIDPNGVFSHLHELLARALAWDSTRYANASELLDAFNEAVRPTESGLVVLKRLQSFKTIVSQMQLFMRFPAEEVISDNSFTTIWKSHKDGEPVLLKKWNRASWSDGNVDLPQILDFLERARQLAISPPPGCVPLKDAIWLDDSFVLIQAYIDAPNLAMYQMINRNDSDNANNVLSFALRLVKIIIALHETGIAHGDLKPENILVYGKSSEPYLIDYLDFCCVADGELKTTAYAPISGGTQDRDRFAVTKIVEEILSELVLADEIREKVANAIAACRGGQLANATLLPLQDTLAIILEPAKIDQFNRFCISLHDATTGLMLPDEGIYGYGFYGRQFYIRGASDVLFFNLNGTQIIKGRIFSAQQSFHRRLLIHQEGLFSGEINIIGGVSDSFKDLQTLFTEPEFVELLTRHKSDLNLNDDEVEQITEGQDPAEDVVTTLAETDEDAVTEFIDRSRPRNQSSIPELWRTLVDVEVSLTNEATTQGPSIYLKDLKLHAVPISLECGTFEFSRNDKVTIERLGNDNKWRRVGLLDVSMSSSEFIYIDVASWGSSIGNLLDDEQRLRFQSQLHFADITRRDAAVKRILSQKSVIQNLIEYFDPSSSPRIWTQPVDIDISEIRSLYGLNQRQADAMVHAFNVRPISLLQGPPGTGKTRWIGALVHYALSRGHVRNVLLASQSHEAVNNAAEAVLKLFPSTDDAPSILRIGHEEKVSEQLLPYHVAKVEQLYKDKFSATLKQRLLIASGAIGIPEHVAKIIVLVETTIRPVVEQMNNLATDKEPDGVLERIRSQLQTLEKMINGLEIDIELPDISMVPDEYLMDNIYDVIAQNHHCAPDLIAKLRAVSRLTRDIIGSVSTADRSFETFLAGTRQIVAGTCVGLGRSSLGLTSTAFDLVIIDEAARCSASELAVPMQAGRWIVLVGDQKQLEPRLQEKVVSMVAAQTGYAAEDIVKSAFEQVFDSPLGPRISQKLNVQYRMLPPIGRVIANAFYNKDLEAGRDTSPVSHSIYPLGLENALTWIYTDSMRELAYQSKESGRAKKSLINRVEVDLIVGMLNDWDKDDTFVDWLKTREDPEPAIGIICTYGAQGSAIRHKIQLANLSETMRNALKIDTVDSYQGKENRIVILSLVRNNADGPHIGGRPFIRPGFMSRPNRINVAVSRAMDRLVIVGARERWMSGGPMSELKEKFEQETNNGYGVFIDAVNMLGKQHENQKLGALLQNTEKLPGEDLL